MPGTGGVVGTLIVAVLSLVWLLVPFAIFGIKGLLREILAEQRRTNALLSHGQPALPVVEPQPFQPGGPHRYP